MKSRWDDLALLLAVVDAGGFTAAAERLGTSTARLSRAVSRLERQLDTTLVQRTTRRLRRRISGQQSLLAKLNQGLDEIGIAKQP